MEQNQYIENVPTEVSFSSQKKYVKKILDSKESHSIDDAINLGVYKTGLKSTQIIKRLL